MHYKHPITTAALTATLLAVSPVSATGPGNATAHIVVADASDPVNTPAAAITARATTDSLVARIVDRVDKLYRSSTSHSRFEMLIVNPNWERRLVMEIWTRGMNETFIRIETPKKDAGIATLRRGAEMWNFFPKIDKVMKVPPSMMMGSWMGSDFSNDDCHECLAPDDVRRFVDDIRARGRGAFTGCHLHREKAQEPRS
ncbi:MAG TPA: outer membrane lipoprotein-sorting protein [Candidatus Latescibacteria bacterium]|nr:outer membrane lipoprotein-sorting protein [Candidatus Latescibacterota bacterium]